jgi:VTC domain
MSTDGEIVRAGFEHKYLVSEGAAETLLSAVRTLLPPDPYGGRYTVASLYLDTPDLASYRREVQGKWRLRRYSTTETVFAEFKAKPEPGKVHKRRTPLTPDACLALPAGKPSWFQRAIHKQSLAPTRMVSYTRDAFVGQLDGEEVRLTLDHAIQASPCQDFVLPGTVQEGVPLTEERILEIKFEHALPSALAQLTAELGLLPESFSKYRTAIERA